MQSYMQDPCNFGKIYTLFGQTRKDLSKRLSSFPQGCLLISNLVCIYMCVRQPPLDAMFPALADVIHRYNIADVFKGRHDVSLLLTRYLQCLDVLTFCS